MVFTGYGHFKREREYHQYDSGNTGIGGVNRPGESIYQYVLRQIPIGIKHGCVLEEKILKGLGKEHLHNTIFWNYLSTTVLAFLVFEFFGEVSLVAFIAQMIVTIFMNYALQYVQHYGMLSINSIKCDEGLAWEHDMVVENMIFTNVGHHAKHHKNHFMPNFLVNKTEVKAPKLPYNYATMILLSLFPGFWFAWMDENLSNWYEVSEEISP
jgi:fatty acid desaturase